MTDILHEYGMLFLTGSWPDGPPGGIAATLLLSVISIGAAFPLSILLALAQLSTRRFLRYPATVVRYLLRSIPLVMLIFGAYFVAPVILGYPVGGFTTLAVTLVVFQTVYLAEIVRTGIQSLPAGQTEAAASMGMGYWLTMRRVILPQALSNMLPSIAGQFVTAVKDTSLGYVIGVNELTYAAGQVNSSLLTRPFAVFMVLALFYFIICFSLTQASRWLERRLQRRRSGTAPAVRDIRAKKIPELSRP